jgi:hypothetical protein
VTGSIASLTRHLIAFSLITICPLKMGLSFSGLCARSTLNFHL